MAQLPTVMKVCPGYRVDIDYKPTAMDPAGVDGVYIKNVTVKWYGFIFLFLMVLWDRVKHV